MERIGGVRGGGAGMGWICGYIVVVIAGGLGWQLTSMPRNLFGSRTVIQHFSEAFVRVKRKAEKRKNL